MGVVIVEGVNFEFGLCADLVDLGGEEGEFLAEGLDGGALLFERVVEVVVFGLDVGEVGGLGG